VAIILGKINAQCVIVNHCGVLIAWENGKNLSFQTGFFKISNNVDHVFQVCIKASTVYFILYFI